PHGPKSASTSLPCTMDPSGRLLPRATRATRPLSTSEEASRELPPAAQARSPDAQASHDRRNLRRGVHRAGGVRRGGWAELVGMDARAGAERSGKAEEKVIQIKNQDIWDLHRDGIDIVVTTNIGWCPRSMRNNMGAGTVLRASLQF